MFLLNRSFHLILLRLDELKPLLTPLDLKEMRGMTQEIQLGINTGVLNTLDSAENNDHAHFGKTRLALEKRLKKPI
jgi:hypothetical protein